MFALALLARPLHDHSVVLFQGVWEFFKDTFAFGSFSVDERDSAHLVGGFLLPRGIVCKHKINVPESRNLYMEERGIF